MGYAGLGSVSNIRGDTVQRVGGVPACPGQEVYDGDIGACTCPKGMITTMVVGECQLDYGKDARFKKTAGACDRPADCPEDWTKPKTQRPYPVCPDGPQSTWVSQFGLTLAQLSQMYGGCLCKGGFRWSEEGAQCVPVSTVAGGQPGPGARPGGAKPSTPTSRAGISLGTGTMVGLAVGAVILLGAWAWEPGPPARKPLR